MASFFAVFGILHETSCPHTPEQNGVAESKHGHIIQTSITVVQQAPCCSWEHVRKWKSVSSMLYLFCVIG